MHWQAKVIIMLLSISLFFFVLNLIRKRRMKIEYSILWIITSSTALFISIMEKLADQIAARLSIDYPPALYFSIAFFFAFAMLLHFSVEISKLKDNNKTLTQDLAIYKQRLDLLEKKLNTLLLNKNEIEARH